MSATRESTQSSPAGFVAALEAKAERFETPSGDGRMVWRRWGEGPPLVLLHGGSGSWTHWIRNIDGLGRVRQLWVPDMPGYADSALPLGDVDFASIAAELCRGIESLLPRDQTFDLAGFSFGSHTSQYVASHFGDRIRQLVLINGHLMGELKAMPQQLLTRWRDVTDPLERRAILTRNLSALMLSHASLIDDLALHIYEADVVRSRIRPAAFINDRDMGLIARLRCPIAAIAGELDPLASPSVAAQRELFLQARPDGRFHIVPGAGHWVAYEAADRFNAVLLTILAGQA